MQIELTKTGIITSIVSAAVAFTGGVIIDKFYQMKHTPEDMIRNLNEATIQNKASKSELAKQQREASAALNDLRKEKQKYQDEIRPEIEARVRKELENYISRADETYEKAKHENEMAKLRLELVREKSE